MDNIENLGDQLKQPVSEMAQQAQQAAVRIAQQARHQIAGQLDAQKGRLADGMNGIGEVLEETSRQLNEKGQPTISSYTHAAAAQLQEWSDFLRSQELQDLATQVESFARSKPGLFIGGLLLTGFLAARFLKSSPTTIPDNRALVPIEQSGARLEG